MIEVLKNHQGLVYAFCEWEIVNKYGQFERYGDYIYVQNIWIASMFRRRKALQHLIGLIYRHKFTFSAKWVYWESENRDKIHGPFDKTKLGEKYGKQKIRPATNSGSAATALASATGN